MAAPVGALRVTLGANTANFEQGMRRAQATARRTGQDMERSYIRMTQSGVRAFSTLRSSIGAFAAVMAGNALFRQGRDAVQWAAGLSEASRQIGVTVEQLQILRLAAQQNGASVEGMERAVAILNRTLGQARAGLPAAIQSFRALGITKEQLAGFRNAGDAIPRVMEAIRNLRTESEQAAAAQRLFGRGASELLPLLQQGAAGWDAATQAAIRHGMITQEQAEKADEASDAIAALASSLRVELASALVDIMPTIRVVMELFAGLARVVIWVVQQVQNLVGWLARPLNMNVGFIAGQQDLGRRGQALVLAEVRRRSGNAPIGSAAHRRAVQEVARDPQWANAARHSTRLANGGQTAQPGPVSPTGSTDLDLSPSGGGSRRRDDSARRAHEFASEERRLQIETLRAQMENTEALDQRNYIQGQIVTLENAQWLADVRFRQSQDEINGAQASRLIELKSQLLVTEAIGRALEYNHRIAEQENERAERQEGYAQERMRFEADMAETMRERRRLELELLRITMENRRRALQAQVDQANARNDPHGASMAQLELDSLGNVEGRERRRIIRDTRGPLESLIAGLPLTADRMNEALENVAANGLNAISDGLLDIITGAENMGKVFKRIASQIISDLLRIQIQRAILGPLANALSGLMGGGGAGGGAIASAFNNIWGGARASGGPVLPGRTYVVGEKGPELLRMGGTGGFVFANDNIGSGGGDVTIHQTFAFEGVAVTQEEFIQGLVGTKNATIAAIRQLDRRRA